MYKTNSIFLLIFLFTLTFITSSYSLKVLELGGNTEAPNWDLQALMKFPKVAGEDISYTTTKDRNLPELDINSYDVLWMGQGEVQENNYFFNKDIEDRIKMFVEAGGAVVSANQDSDGGNPCGVGWLTKPIVGIEASAHGCTPTPEAGELFSVPNQINPENLNLDDTWTQPDKDFILLATAGANVSFAMLRHGKGIYLVTDMETHNATEVEANAPMHENILYFIIKWRKENLFYVAPSGKLPAAWGEIKEAR